MFVAAETLGFQSYAPPYLSPQASGKNLLIGANFASAASSYYDDTAAMYVSTIHTYMFVYIYVKLLLQQAIFSRIR